MKEKIRLADERVKSKRGLKLLSAISMALPVFANSGQKAFAANQTGLHYQHISVKNPPKNVHIEKNSWGDRYWATIGVDPMHEAIHGTFVEKGAKHESEARLYCLQPSKYTPSGTSTLTSKYPVSSAVKKVLRVGFGANSADEMGYPGKSSECEYATQVAVWHAQGVAPNIIWHNATVHKIYDDINKKAAKVTGTGHTDLKLKATDVDKNWGGK